MQFTNYADFRTAVLKFIDGDNISTSFSIDSLDLFIGLAEQRVYRDLRVSTMQKPLSVVVASNVATLPTDLAALKEAYFDARRPLEVVPLDRLRALSYGGSPGQSAYAAQDGDTLRFWPEATGTLLGSYYARPTAMKDETTWANQTTLARYPEVFVFASLVESMPFLGEESKLPVWEGKYQQALENARSDDRWRVYGGSQLRTRTS